MRMPQRGSCVRHPTHDELFKRRPVCSGALDGPRHERKAQRHPGEQESGQDKDRELQHEDPLHTPLREVDQRPGNGER